MLKVGMGSNACSRNSKMLGVMMVSSGILCNVIQADKVAFLAPPFLEVIQLESLEAEGSKNKVVSSFSTFEM